MSLERELNVAGQQEARDAQVRAEEREACARLCEELARQTARDAEAWGTALLKYRASTYRAAARHIRERKE